MSSLVAVEGAYVPVMKLVFLGVDIDLLFARLAAPAVPKLLPLADDALVAAMEEKAVLALNGARVVECMLRLVPQASSPQEKRELRVLEGGVLLISAPQGGSVSVGGAAGQALGAEPRRVRQRDGLSGRRGLRHHGRPHLPGKQPLCVCFFFVADESFCCSCIQTRRPTWW